MAKKKTALYVIIICIFVVLCTVFVLFLSDGSQQAGVNVLNGLIDDTAKVIRLNAENRISELKLLLHENESFDVSSQDGYSAYLATLEQKRPGTKLRLFDAQGNIYSAGGPIPENIADTDMLHESEVNGHVYARIFDGGPDAQDVALVLPLPQAQGLYLAEVYTVEEYVHGLMAGTSTDENFVEVFDGWGNSLAALPYEGGDTQAIRESMREGVQTFAWDDVGDSMMETETGTDYNVYLALDEPQGWFLGIHIPSEVIAPFLPDMLLAVVLIVVAVGITVLLILLFERGIKRDMEKTGKTDELTGLSNGADMTEALETFFRKNSCLDYCFVCLDISAFHRFNSMYGYAMGDDLLRAIGSVIRSRFQMGFRISNDDFMFLAAKDTFSVHSFLRELQEAVRVALGPQYIQVIVFKMGVHPIADAGESVREISDSALFALKQAKLQPEQTAVYYDEEMKTLAEMQKNIEVNMIHALSKGEFEIFIQPKFDVMTRQCCSGEALVRWESDQMGFVEPDQFISLFESNGFIVEIDFYVLTSVLDILQQDMDSGREILPISVNQSKVTIAFPNYIERLEKTIGKYTVPLEYIEIEVTESSFESDNDSVGTLMQAIKNLGFTVAMDDFGSGYSSLNALRKLPVDVIKIDKEFLHEADTSEPSKKIIKSIISMSGELGIKVVCEGVETEKQLEFLQSIHCDIAQGYLFSHPLPFLVFTDEYFRRRQ